MADEYVSQRRAPIESAAVAGIVSSVLGAAAGLLFRFLDPSLSDDELVNWYLEDSNRWRAILGLNLAVLSSIAFLWFVAVIRRRIGEREDRFFATVFFGSAIVWIVVWIAGAVSLSAVPLAHGFAEDWTPSPDVARLGIGLGAGWLVLVGPRVQAVFIFSTSTLFVRTRAVPSWLGYFGYAMGLVLFFFPLVSRPVAFGFPLWITVASATILIVRRTHEVNREEAGPDQAPPGSLDGRV